MEPIHVVKNRIDESRSKTAVHVRKPNIPKSQRPEFQIVKNLEESGLLTTNTMLAIADRAPSSQSEDCLTPLTDNLEHTPVTPSTKRHCKKCFKKQITADYSELLHQNELEGDNCSTRINLQSPNKYTPLEVKMILLSTFC